MCLSIPGKLIAITSQLDETFRMGKVSFDGIIKEVSLTLVPEANVGDYVLVHVGAAISTINEEEAKKTAPILLEAQEMLRKWEANDTSVVELWKTMNGWVYEGFNQTYANTNEKVGFG